MWIEHKAVIGVCGSAMLIAGLLYFQPFTDSDSEQSTFMGELRAVGDSDQSADGILQFPTEPYAESRDLPTDSPTDDAASSSIESALIIGEYIDPDRGADLSEPITRMEIGDFIDPERGPDWSEPENPLSVGDYLDPDRGAVFEVNPIEVLSIGQFIDPDVVITFADEGPVEVGEYRDPENF
jgi:hypothetical protein